MLSINVPWAASPASSSVIPMSTALLYTSPAKPAPITVVLAVPAPNHVARPEPKDVNPISPAAVDVANAPITPDPPVVAAAPATAFAPPFAAALAVSCAALTPSILLAEPNIPRFAADLAPAVKRPLATPAP